MLVALLYIFKVGKNIFTLKCSGFFLLLLFPPPPHVTDVLEVHVYFADFETMFRDTPKKKRNKSKLNPKLSYYFLPVSYAKMQSNCISSKIHFPSLYYRHSSV